MAHRDAGPVPSSTSCGHDSARAATAARAMTPTPTAFITILSAVTRSATVTAAVSAAMMTAMSCAGVSGGAGCGCLACGGGCCWAVAVAAITQPFGTPIVGTEYGWFI